uniref:(northern house mosquito) hypothetical protein n=1 Tax=Culex pipiens TaxID=7175 RepID=A0A8D8MAD4_CULPI
MCECGSGGASRRDRTRRLLDQQHDVHLRGQGPQTQRHPPDRLAAVPVRVPDSRSLVLHLHLHGRRLPRQPLRPAARLLLRVPVRAPEEARRQRRQAVSPRHLPGSLEAVRPLWTPHGTDRAADRVYRQGGAARDGGLHRPGRAAAGRGV